MQSKNLLGRKGIRNCIAFFAGNVPQRIQNLKLAYATYRTINISKEKVQKTLKNQATSHAGMLNDLIGALSQNK